MNSNSALGGPGDTGEQRVADEQPRRSVGGALIAGATNAMTAAMTVVAAAAVTYLVMYLAAGDAPADPHEEEILWWLAFGVCGMYLLPAFVLGGGSGVVAYYVSIPRGRWAFRTGFLPGLLTALVVIACNLLSNTMR